MDRPPIESFFPPFLRAAKSSHLNRRRLVSVYLQHRDENSRFHMHRSATSAYLRLYLLKDDPTQQK